MKEKKLETYDLFQLFQISEMLNSICKKYGSLVISYGNRMSSTNGIGLNQGEEYNKIRIFDGYKKTVDNVIEDKLKKIFDE